MVLAAPCLQIAVRISQQEAGQLDEVHFILFAQDTLDAWLHAAEAAQLQQIEDAAGGEKGEL